MPSYAIKYKTFVYERDSLFECSFIGEDPVTPFTFVGGSRTEVRLINNSIFSAPGRGILKRIVVSQQSGIATTFDIDICDKPFSAGTPNSQNIIFQQTAVVTVVNGKLTLNALIDVPYELSSEIASERTLFVGILPDDDGVFDIKIYIEPRN